MRLGEEPSSLFGVAKLVSRSEKRRASSATPKSANYWVNGGGDNFAFFTLQFALERSDYLCNTASQIFVFFAKNTSFDFVFPGN